MVNAGKKIHRRNKQKIIRNKIAKFNKGQLEWTDKISIVKANEWKRGKIKTTATGEDVKYCKWRAKAKKLRYGEKNKWIKRMLRVWEEEIGADGRSNQKPIEFKVVVGSVHKNK